MKHFSNKTSRWLLAAQLLMLLSPYWLAVSDWIDPPPHSDHDYFFVTAIDILATMLPLLGMAVGIVNSIWGGPYASRWISFALTILIAIIGLFFLMLAKSGAIPGGVVG